MSWTRNLRSKMIWAMVWNSLKMIPLFWSNHIHGLGVLHNARRMVQTEMKRGWKNPELGWILERNLLLCDSGRRRNVT